MSTVGFLYNFAEGSVSRHPFFLYRIAPMATYLDQHGVHVFVFSPRHVDRDSAQVLGFICRNGKFESARLPVPEVNGNWYLGADKSIRKGGMGGRAFRAWAKKRGVALYPSAEFTDQLRDKFLTYKLLSDIDPSLHPYTEIFEDDPAQLERFLERGEKIFLKPNLGNKGNRIVVVTKIPPGLLVDYYDQTNKHSDLFPDCSRMLQSLRPVMADVQYVVQLGIPLTSHDNATFILRVIMLHDGERWGWVHKAVLAAEGSEIANTTQGGSNHPTAAFLARIYGEEAVESLMAEIRRVCFGTIEKLDEDFGNGLMEVGYDLVIDDDRRVHIVEINTRPGMTKPGLPMGNAFRNIFDRTAEEDALYGKFVHPHGTALAKFLLAKLQAHERSRRSQALRPVSESVRAKRARTADAPLSLEAAIHNAAAYLTRACREDGTFEYRVNLDPSVRIKPRYDLARHAGAIYSLCDYLDESAAVASASAALRAATFLRDRCLAAIDNEPSCLGIWSLPELESKSGQRLVRLGGVGLGLLAFLAVEKHAPGLVTPGELRGLGRFVLAAQNPDGSFASSYVPARGGFADRSVTSYPGRAALALCSLFERDPDPRWAETSLRALAHLARIRRDRATSPADHWGLMATAKVLRFTQDHSGAVSEKDLMDHAARVCESILRKQILQRDDRGRFGGFSADGLTAPTATRLKCLLAALSFLPKRRSDLRERMIPAVRHGVDFLLRSQVRDGEHRGGIPRAVGPVSVDRADARVFNRRAGEIRIDYVQHALCALLAFQRLQQSRE